MTMKRTLKIMPFLALLALSGCATLPIGPSVMVMPAPGKPFEEFQAEVATCRQWANQQMGREYHAYESDEAQRRYDNAYIQCMYAKGNELPAARRAP